MAYIGQSIKNGTFTDLGFTGTFNSSTTDFNLGTQLGSAAQILVSKNGVIQRPGTDFTLASNGSQISFTTAPASGDSIFIVEISGAVGGPMNRDINGDELILDVDGDTSITADTDDQIDIKIGGTDQFSIKDGVIEPTTDNDVDLGSSSKEFKDAFFDGTVTSDSGTFDTLGVGSAKDLGTGIHIKTADSGASAHGDADELVIEGSGASGLSILSANDNNGNILFSDDGGNEMGALRYLHSNNVLRFDANNGERMRLEGDKLLHAKTSAALGTVGTELYSTGVLRLTADSAAPLVLNREGSDGYVLSVNNDESFEGGITFSGGTITYQAFVGAHFSRLADNSKPTILRGTVLESIATMCDWYQAVADVAEVKDSEGNIITPAHKVKEMISLPVGKSVGDAVTFTSGGKEYTGTYVKETNERLPMCKISDTEDSKAVYGVFNAWDDQNDGLNAEVNDMIVASLGAYLVRIHKDETVAIGDYLQSKGDGTAKKQSDDIFRGSTIAKVISTEKTVTYDDGSYCVPCTLHCG